jgi:hypothetical protein
MAHAPRLRTTPAACAVFLARAAGIDFF